MTVQGPVIHLGEILQWRTNLKKMDETLRGEAELPTIEPNLYVKLSCDHLGRIQGECKITPDNLNQNHEFRFEIDQSYLKGLVNGCDRILAEYPIRDPQQKE